MADDHEHQELSHIRMIVIKLERLMQDDDMVGGKTPVIQPEYRRNRINALLAAPTVSKAAVVHASALLAQLDGIADALKKSG